MNVTFICWIGENVAASFPAFRGTPPAWSALATGVAITEENGETNNHAFQASARRLPATITLEAGTGSCTPAETPSSPAAIN